MEKEDYEKYLAYLKTIQDRFPIGSVVSLKSGSPKMTVEHIDVGHSEATIRVIALLYIDNQDVIRQRFPPQTLNIEIE